MHAKCVKLLSRNWVDFMKEILETSLLVISVLLIALVLLQGNKAEAGGQIISGGNDELFSNQKERGSELLITRLTGILGAAFFIISLILYLQ
jgi:preprotein translocase subunit SecG